jgi:hypothetical protein
VVSAWPLTKVNLSSLGAAITDASVKAITGGGMKIDFLCLSSCVNVTDAVVEFLPSTLLELMLAG